eukprot:COSAG01_NODE_28567_length_658_cov_0.921288_1_plen_88_part_00
MVVVVVAVVAGAEAVVTVVTAVQARYHTCRRWPLPTVEGCCSRPGSRMSTRTVGSIERPAQQTSTKALRAHQGARGQRQEVGRRASA